MSNSSSDLRTAPSREWTLRIQFHGLLNKKSLGPNSSNKWTRRFFLVRDGFLMYYAEQEKKEFEKRDFFNMHPKGIIPLGSVKLEVTQDPNNPFCLQISSEGELEGSMLLAAESNFELEKWKDVMEKSRRVTWDNTQLSDNMIRQLEKQGIDMAKDKQDYFDRLQSESNALSEERTRADMLAKINTELEKEKQKLEQFTAEIQEEYERMRVELEETVLLMRDIEDEKTDLNDVLEKQIQQLSQLEQDRKKVEKELEEREKAASQLSQEKESLSETTEQLKHRLQDIEQRTQSVRTEKQESESGLQDKLERLQQLEEEKAAISEHAQELSSTIKDLKAQKEITEQELREEVKARLSAEERLREAERSLTHLDTAVQNQTPHLNQEVHQEMTTSVRKLKSFFEELATESKISSEKPLIMRNSMTARKTLVRRANTVKYQNRKQVCKSWSPNTSDSSGLQLRRSVTSVTPNSKRPSNNRTMSTDDSLVFEEEEEDQF